MASCKCCVDHHPGHGCSSPPPQVMASPVRYVEQSPQCCHHSPSTSSHLHPHPAHTNPVVMETSPHWHQHSDGSNCCPPRVGHLHGQRHLPSVASPLHVVHHSSPLHPSCHSCHSPHSPAYYQPRRQLPFAGHEATPTSQLPMDYIQHSPLAHPLPSTPNRYVSQPQRHGHSHQFEFSSPLSPSELPQGSPMPSGFQIASSCPYSQASPYRQSHAPHDHSAQVYGPYHDQQLPRYPSNHQSSTYLSEPLQYVHPTPGHHPQSMVQGSPRPTHSPHQPMVSADSREMPSPRRVPLSNVVIHLQRLPISAVPKQEKQGNTSFAHTAVINEIEEDNPSPQTVPASLKRGDEMAGSMQSTVKRDGSDGEGPEQVRRQTRSISPATLSEDETGRESPQSPLMLPDPISSEDLERLTNEPEVGDGDGGGDGTEEAKLEKDEEKPKIKEVALTTWSVKVIGKSITLQGVKEGDPKDRKWHSGPVVSRVTARRLTTQSGTIYRLVGKTDTKELSRKKGVSWKFRNGFPKNWRDLIGDEAQMVDDQRLCQVEKLQSRYLSIKEEAELSSSNLDTSDSGTAGHFSPQKRSSRGRNIQAPSSLNMSTPTLNASNSVTAGFLSSLKRSSRGRIIKPPSWSLNMSTEIYSYDMLGGFTGLRSPIIDLTGDEPRILEPAETPRLRIKKESQSLKLVGSVKKENQSAKRLPVCKDNDRASSTEEETVERETSTASAHPDPAELSAVNTFDVSDGQCKSSSVKKRKRGVIPLALRKSRKKVLRVPTTDEESDDSAHFVATTRQTDRHHKSVLDKEAPRKSKKKVFRLPITDEESDDSAHSAVARRRQTGMHHKSDGSDKEAPRKSKNKVLRVPITDEESDSLTPSAATRRQTGRHHKNDGSDKEAPSVATKETSPKPDPSRSKVSSKRQRRPPSRKTVGWAELPPEASKSQEWSLGDEDRQAGESEGVSGKEWRPGDIQRLKSIVQLLPAVTKNLWEVVAQTLDTGHTARECNNQYLLATSRASRRKQAGRRDGAKEAKALALPTITARVGTLRRKRQLRSALEHFDQGYSDDIFESTPFRKKVKSVLVPDLSDSELEVGGSGTRPMATPSEVKHRLGAPTSRTPKLSDYQSTPESDGVTRRAAADTVIYKIQKAKKGGKKGTSHKLPSNRSIAATRKVVDHEPSLRNIRTGELTTFRTFEDSEDDSDSDSNPFSDIEEPYRDILSALH